MAGEVVGKVLKLAVRTGRHAPMREIESVRATADGGLAGDVESEPDRGITLLASEQWAAATRELNVELPWYTRRANVLVEGGSMAAWVGSLVSIGEIQVRIMTESRPCGLMDRFHDGLRAALTPEYRGGVCGHIVKGGVLRVGDLIQIERQGTE